MMPDLPPGELSSTDLARTRALQAHQIGDFATAATLCETALKTNRRDAEILVLLASSKIALGEPNQAVRHAKRAVQLRPDHAGSLCTLAHAYNENGQVGLAFRTLDEAIKAEPGFPQALYYKSRMFQELGRDQEAFDLIAPAVRSGGADPTVIVAFANLAKRFKVQGEAIDQLRVLLDRTDFALSARHEAFFALGHLLDSVGDFDDAFEAFTRGNQMLRPGPILDVDAYIEEWSRGNIEAMPIASNASRLPVLVVGMPRSGTTLTEQVLAAHPGCSGVGESPLLGAIGTRFKATPPSAESMNSAANEYIAMLQAADASAERVVDKMPDNFLSIGLASRLLPGATVIHALRDPRDTCLSCFFQDFGPRHTYSTDLAACAQQYLRNERLMDHWRSTVDLPIISSYYEDLVSDPEPWVRSTLDAIGLPFDDSCLRFHESTKRVTTASMSQVRSPIYRSSRQRWRNYERHLGPMLDVLEPVLGDFDDRYSVSP